MTTNKPEVFAVYNVRAGTKGDAVRLSDYEALQAECDQLRKDAERLDWLDAQNAPFRMGWKCGIAPAGNVQLHTVIQLGASPAKIRDAIDAAMQGDQP